jgi:hypothetical protein
MTSYATARSLNKNLSQLMQGRNDPAVRTLENDAYLFTPGGSEDDPFMTLKTILN